MSQLAAYNPINPQCTVVPCLLQVAGRVNDDLDAQISGCQSQFGFPLIPTVWLPEDDTTVTSTVTSTYTDIFVSTSTVSSTVDHTSTSYETDYATSTAYTATIVDTLTTTITASSSAPLKKRETPRRRACTPRSASTNPTTSSAPFPLATDCPDLAAYSSACACIQPATVTQYTPGETYSWTVTETATLTSTSVPVVTVVTTTVIVNPGTTTLTSTLSTQTETTTTSTQIATPSAAVPTAFTLETANGANSGRQVAVSGNAPAYTLSWSAGVSVIFQLPSPGTTPVLAGSTTYQMYVRLSTTSYGIIFMTTSAYVGSSPYTWQPVTCSLDPTTVTMNCATSNGLTRFLTCGNTFYMANAATLPGGCAVTQLEYLAAS